MNKRRFGILLVLLLCLLSLPLLIACGEEPEPPVGEQTCTHSLTHHEAVAATCGGEGNTEYWSCDQCGKYFSDAAGSTEITDKDSVRVDRLKHLLSRHQKVEATCGNAGNIEHFSCVACGELFFDSEAMLEIADTVSVILPQAAHPFVLEYNETTHWGSYACEHGLSATEETPHTLDDQLCCTGCGFQTGTPGMEYKLNSNGESYTLVYAGAAFASANVIVPSFYNGKPVTAISGMAFSEALSSVRIPDTVTLIQSNTFRQCRNLTAVTIPASVQRISTAAFEECTALTAVHITDPEAWCKILFENAAANPLNGGATLYLNGEPVTAFTVPSTISAIGDYAFYNCDSLQTIKLPLSVETIGNGAFGACSALVEADIPPTVTSIGEQAFMDCYALKETVIPSCVSVMGEGAFRSCIRLEQVTFGKRSCLVTLPKEAFYGCYSLKSVIFEEGSVLEDVGESAFFECDSMTIVSFSSALKTIKRQAFQNCEELTALITLPGELRIFENAFPHCEKLIQRENGAEYVNQWLIGYDANATTVVLRDNTTIIADQALKNCNAYINGTLPASLIYVGALAFESCTKLQSLTISSSLAVIGESAFRRCFNLKSVELPATLTEIKKNTFAQCSALETVTIAPDSRLEVIHTEAFLNCSKLTSVTIPVSVKKITSDAFESCTGLTSVYYGGVARNWGEIDGTEYNYSGPIIFTNYYIVHATRYYYSESEPTSAGNYWHYDVDGSVAVWPAVTE